MYYWVYFHSALNLFLFCIQLFSSTWTISEDAIHFPTLYFFFICQKSKVFGCEKLCVDLQFDLVYKYFCFDTNAKLFLHNITWNLFISDAVLLFRTDLVILLWVIVGVCFNIKQLWFFSLCKKCVISCWIIGQRWPIAPLKHCSAFSMWLLIIPFLKTPLAMSKNMRKCAASQLEMLPLLTRNHSAERYYKCYLSRK